MLETNGEAPPSDVVRPPHLGEPHVADHAGDEFGTKDTFLVSDPAPLRTHRALNTGHSKLRILAMARVIGGEVPGRLPLEPAALNLPGQPVSIGRGALVIYDK